MNIVDLIIKKRDKLILNGDEIKFFVNGVTDGSIQDYQISSMLMAILLNGMTEKETSDLTLAMANSGDVLNLSGINAIKVDKHSTGGVADTTTLILAPLVASLGVPVIKMSGRGLGYTGGTLDKLQSIPNLKVELSKDEAIKLVKDSGIVIMSQTKNLAPADKKLYALRDVTGTVNSLPLIASSIMSKKIAVGTDAIVLDVKCGSGAFMKNLDEAVKLANEMVKIGKNVGKSVVAVISNMNQPLGMCIGNSFEVIEAIEVLKGNIKGDLLEVSILLGAYMLREARITDNIEQAQHMLIGNIENGKGLQKFRDMIQQQGGDICIIENYNLLPEAKIKFELKSDKSGYIYNIDCEKIGKAFVETGAGRKVESDTIDFGAGIKMKVRLGDKVEKDDLLAEIYASLDERCILAQKYLKEAIIINDTKPIIGDLILSIV